MFGPATQPAHAPVVEPGAQRNRHSKAKVFRFNLHAISDPPLVHTFMPLCVRNGKSDGRGKGWAAVATSRPSQIAFKPLLY